MVCTLQVKLITGHQKWSHLSEKEEEEEKDKDKEQEKEKEKVHPGSLREVLPGIFREVQQEVSS